MDKTLSMKEAVGRYVEDGMTVALEGFSHLIPFAAAHEIIRQGRKDLTLCRMTPDIVSDQLVAAGCVRKLVASFFASGSAGSLYELRRRIENQDPLPLEVEEYSHYGMVCRYQAGAARLPFFPLRSYAGSDLPALNPQLRLVEDPYGGGSVYVVPPLNPDVTIIGAQRAGHVRERTDLGHRRGAARSRLRREEGDRRCGRACRRRGHQVRSEPNSDSLARRRRGCRLPARRAPVVRTGILRPRLRLLPTLDRDFQRPFVAEKLARRMGVHTRRSRRISRQARS